MRDSGDMVMVDREGWDTDYHSIRLHVAKIVKEEGIFDEKFVPFSERKCLWLESHDEHVVLAQVFGGFEL